MSVYDLRGESQMDYEVINAYGGERAQSHIEIDAHPEVTKGPQWEKERQDSHAAERTRMFPDCYVNCEDVTITVDPLKNEHWMVDDSVWWRHHSSKHRGALKDHRAVMSTLRTMERGHAPPETTFIPTSAMIDRMPKFTPLPLGNSTWGHRVLGSHSEAGVLYPESRGEEVPIERFGRLPAVSERIYKGADVCPLRPGCTTDPLELALYFENAPLTFYRSENRAFDCGPRWLSEACR